MATDPQSFTPREDLKGKGKKAVEHFLNLEKTDIGIHKQFEYCVKSGWTEFTIDYLKDESLIDKEKMFIQIEACLEFLEMVKPIKTINRSSGDYNLKHDVERYFRRVKNTFVYVMKLSFIIACIYAGYDYKHSSDDKTFYFALSEKDLNKLRKFNNDD